jgi:hypothetical protein
MKSQASSRAAPAPISPPRSAPRPITSASLGPITSPGELVEKLMKTPVVEEDIMLRSRKSFAALEFLNWEVDDVITEFDPVFFVQNNGQFKAVDTETKQQFSQPPKNSNFSGLWIWISSKPLFQRLKQCRDVNRDIWKVIQWLYFPEIVKALSDRAAYNQETDLARLTDARKYNIFAIFVVELLDVILDCLLSDSQLAISFLPLELTDADTDIAETLTALHPTDSLMSLSGTQRFSVLWQTNDDMKDFQLFRNVAQMKRIYEFCNRYDVDSMFRTICFQKIRSNDGYGATSYPLTQMLLQSVTGSFPIQGVPFWNAITTDTFRLINGTRAEVGISLPPTIQWPSVLIDMQTGESPTPLNERLFREAIILDTDFAAIDKARDNNGFYRYLLSTLGENQIMFARNDVLAITCSQIGEHDLDILMVHRYKRIIDIHFTQFLSTPALFGGGGTTAQFVNDSFSQAQIFTNFIAFEVYFCFWKLSISETPYFNQSMARSICEIFRSQQAYALLSAHFARTVTGSFSNDEELVIKFIQEVFTFFNLGSIPPSKSLRLIQQIFSGMNTLDAIMLCQFCPIVAEIRETIGINENNVLTASMTSPLMRLKHALWKQYSSDQYDPAFFESIFAKVIAQYIGSRTGTPQDFSTIKEIMQGALFRTSFNYAEYIKSLRLPENLERSYLEKARFQNACGDLIPMISLRGELGCIKNSAWMVSDMKLNNTWLVHIVNNVIENIMKGGFWYCASSTVKDVVQHGLNYNIDTNNRRAIHILRWLGVRFMQTASYSYQETKNWDRLSRSTQNVIRMIRYMNRSPSVFPFIDNSATDLMLNYSRNSQAAICRLSVSRPLMIELDVAGNESLEIRFEEWDEAMTTSNSLFKPKSTKLAHLKSAYLAQAQFVLRSIAAKHQFYFVRNLEFIRSMAVQCNKQIFFTDTSWGTANKFGFGSLHEELASVSNIVGKSALWDTISEATLQASLNVQEVTQVIKSRCEVPKVRRAYDFGKGTRESRVASQDFITTNTGAKFLFGEFSGDYECLDASLPENEYWMIRKQPFMALNEMEQLKLQWVGQGFPTNYLDLVIAVWPALNDIISKRWCTADDTYQGNRNKTLLVNWLGPRAMTHLMMGPRAFQYPRYDKLMLEDWQTVYALRAMMRCDFFYPFLNPFQQEILAYRHPHKVVVSLDFSFPRQFNVCLLTPFPIQSDSAIQNQIKMNAVRRKRFIAADVFSKFTDFKETPDVIPFQFLLLDYIMNMVKSDKIENQLPVISLTPLEQDMNACGEVFTPRELMTPSEISSVVFQDAVDSVIAVDSIAYLLGHPAMGNFSPLTFKWLTDHIQSLPEVPEKFITLGELIKQVHTISTQEGVEPHLSFYSEQKESVDQIRLDIEYILSSFQLDKSSSMLPVYDANLLNLYNALAALQTDESKKAKTVVQRVMGTFATQVVVAAELQLATSFARTKEEVEKILQANATNPNFINRNIRSEKPTAKFIAIPGKLKANKIPGSNLFADREKAKVISYFSSHVYPKLHETGLLDQDQLAFILNGIIFNNLVPNIRKLFDAQDKTPNNSSMAICNTLADKSNDMEVRGFPPVGWDRTSALRTTKYQELHVGWEFKERSLKKWLTDLKNDLRTRKFETPAESGIRTGIRKPGASPQSAQAAPGVQVIAPPVVYSGPLLQVSGPIQQEYFHATTGVDWADNSETLQQQAETLLENPKTCGQNVYPAFVLSGNRIIPRCGIEGWIANAPLPTDQELLALKDQFPKGVLEFAIELTRESWCNNSGYYNAVRLWRWVGMMCFSQKSLTRIQREALIKKNEDVSSFLLEYAQVDEKAQLSFLDELRKPQDMKTNECERRIQFLAQTIRTGLLYPFIGSHEEAMRYSGSMPDRVVVMLDWSKSGRVQMYYTSTNGSGVQFAHPQAEEIITKHINASTALRLYVFGQFAGGLIADNDLYHTNYSPGCSSSLRIVSVREMLPQAYQEKMDAILHAQKVPGALTAQMLEDTKKLKEMALLAQCKNLTTSEIDQVRNIIILEEAARQPNNAAASANAAQQLYAKTRASTTQDDVRQFQTFALCSRPEFIGYLREKYIAQNPTVSVQDVEHMTRNDLCRALLGQPTLRNIIMPVMVWDLKHVNAKYHDKFGFVDWKRANTDPTFGFDLDTYLRKQYGITLQELIADNLNNTDQTLAKYAQLVNVPEPVANFSARDILAVIQTGSGCSKIMTNAECTMMKVNSRNLCSWQGLTCATATTSALNYLDSVIGAFCQKNLQLESKEVAFIDLTFRSLGNYFKLIKKPKPDSDSLDGKCSLNVGMMTELSVNAASMKTTWFTLGVREFFSNAEVLAVNTQFTLFNIANNVIRPLPKPDLRHVWEQAGNLTKEQAVIFALLVLFYAGLVTGVLVIPQ